MEPFQMLHRGIFRAGSPFHWATVTDLNAATRPHTHDFYEVFVIAEGRILHEVNGTGEVLQACDMELVRPNDRHCYRRRSGEACRFINMAFTPALAYDAFRYVDHGFQRWVDGRPGPCRTAVEPAQVEELARVIQTVNALPDGTGEARFRRLKLVLFDLLGAFAYGENGDDGLPPWLAALVERMGAVEHFTAGLPALYGLSSRTPEHLSRSFRRYLMTTPTDFINGLRLNYVRNMLVTTDLPVAEILAMAGFNSVSHGNHLFRDAYKMAPSEYRKSHGGALVP